MLIEAGSNVNAATTDNGSTPLIAASHKGHAKVVEELLNHGAVVDQGLKPFGDTPLYVASTFPFKFRPKSLTAFLRSKWTFRCRQIADPTWRKSKFFNF